MRISNRSIVTSTLVCAATLAGFACSDAKDVTPPVHPSTDTGVDAPIADARVEDVAAEPDGSVAPRTEVIARFDFAARAFPEGVAVHERVAYVGLVALGKIVAVDLANKQVTDHSTMPPFPASGPGPGGAGAILTGVEADATGRLYAAVDSFVPSAIETGIYRVEKKGEQAAIFGRSPDFRFPNGMAIVEGDAIYVTDSVAGAIFRVALADGATTKWLSHPKLAQVPGTCAVLPADAFQPGANGISNAPGGGFYVTNTSLGAILKIGREADGKAGAVEVLAEDCATLAGADGTAIDAAGRLIVAINNQERIVRFDPATKVVTPLLAGEPLQSPASLAFDGPHLLVANAAFSKFADPPNARPSLLAIDLP
jgi:sugar lactone lactonase YvrE